MSELCGWALLFNKLLPFQHGFVSTTPGSWSSILTYELRSDGFTFATTADASAGNASFLSAPLLWHGGELRINADTTTGSSTRGDGGGASAIAIAAVEQGHKTLDSLPFRGNSTNATVLWPGGGKMDLLRGKTVQLQVTLTGASRLYALRGDFDWQ